MLFIPTDPLHTSPSPYYWSLWLAMGWSTVLLGNMAVAVSLASQVAIRP